MLRCDAHDAFDFRHGIDAQVRGAPRIAGLGTEIDAAGEFAHEHDIHALDDLGLKR